MDKSTKVIGSIITGAILVGLALLSKDNDEPDRVVYEGEIVEDYDDYKDYPKDEIIIDTTGVEEVEA